MSPHRARTLSAHKASYLDPISLDKGDSVSLGREDDEYPGWIWTIARDGKSGWVPIELLAIDGKIAIAKQAYDARELDMAAGVEVKVLRELNGWAEVSDDAGRCGWIPSSTLENR